MSYSNGQACDQTDAWRCQSDGPSGHVDLRGNTVSFNYVFSTDKRKAHDFI